MTQKLNLNKNQRKFEKKNTKPQRSFFANDWLNILDYYAEDEVFARECDNNTYTYELAAKFRGYEINHLEF